MNSSSVKSVFNYSTDLQGSQTIPCSVMKIYTFNYSTDLQGSQTYMEAAEVVQLFNYSTDLQGSQTIEEEKTSSNSLTTLLIYKVLKL